MSTQVAKTGPLTEPDIEALTGLRRHRWQKFVLAYVGSGSLTVSRQPAVARSVVARSPSTRPLPRRSERYGPSLPAARLFDWEIALYQREARPTGC